MSATKKQLVIVGDGESGEIAYEYFTYDSDLEVVAFATERAYLKQDALFGLPVVALEDLVDHYPPSKYIAFVALSSTHLNRARKKLYFATKALGYELATYVSSRAFVWHNVKIGENSMIFENNVLQYNVEIGANVVLWSGNHVGHRSTIGSHTFVTSHVVISGFCTFGESCFLGVNACFADGVTIAEDTVVGMGGVVPKSLSDPGQVWVGNPVKPMKKSAYDAFKVPADQRPPAVKDS